MSPDQLTREQMRTVVDAAVACRDRSYQEFNGSAYLSGHAQEEQDSALAELSDALDRYGL